jgi:ubiquinone biosynthesis protein
MSTRGEGSVRRSSPAGALRRAAIRAAWIRFVLFVRRKPREERRRAAARELARALGGLRGIYTKLGQLLATRADLLSDEARDELAQLVDSAPPVPFAEVRAALARALGGLGRFSWIDPEPLGTASIAQVHRARLRSGPVVALKVRHPELTPARLEADLRRLTRAARRLRRWVGRGEAERAAAELGRALREELDFEREGRVAEAIALHFADDPRVVVPRVHWEACGPGVLALDYVPRLRLDDPHALLAAGTSAEQCLAIAVDAYGRMVFEQGWFHADPHAGNVFAVDETSALRPAGENRPRILFVDFGLSHRLPDALREELRGGLRALLARDPDGILAGLERIGALVPGREARAREALERALAAGASQAIGAGPAAIGDLRELGKRLVRESGAFRVPPELLLWARTLAHVFALAERVAPGANPMPQLLPHLLRFLAGGGRA